ncbi:MAG: class IV adenylate cyclase [Anaerolineae bacterium]|nr:class IV adenylate cyclase [Anaerolineae bacterium]
MPNYTETEIKLYVPDLEAVRERLESAGAELIVPRVFERNVRYENADKTLTPRGMVVRLREDTHARLTYKEDKSLEDGISTRFEAEVEVSDFGVMETILGKLGYMPFLSYEKYRTTYALDGAEVVLDEMPYGNFVEIEGTREGIEQLVGKLALGDAPRFGESYTALFERVKQKLGLTFTDLTFAHFEGVSVEREAFEA